MKPILALFACLIVGLAAGSGTALWRMGDFSGRPLLGTDLRVGGWESDLKIGSPKADTPLRARLARGHPLALTSEQALYFIKSQDDFGEPLNERCTYRLSGRVIAADWWSITLYNGEGRLPPNEDGAYSIRSDQFRAQPGNEKGDWEVLIAPGQPAAHSDTGQAGADSEISSWPQTLLSSRGAGAFNLMLRLYRPDESLLTDTTRDLYTPTIERLTCRPGMGVAQ